MYEVSIPVYDNREGIDVKAQIDIRLECIA